MALGNARAVVCVEHEAAAAELLATRMEEGNLAPAPVWSDLRTFDCRPFTGLVDGVVGGYPCQPFSVAGKRRGTDDPRHLWPLIYRDLELLRPRWAFFENVAGHLRLGYWDVVRPDLERLGYRVEEGIFTASEVGASHRRERLFILAYREGARDRRLPERQWQSRDATANADGREPRVADTGRGPAGRGEPERERGSGGAPDVGDSGPDDGVADPKRERRQFTGAPRKRRPGPPDRGGIVGEPECPRWPEAGERRDEHAGGQPQAGRGTVDDADISGLEGWRGPKRCGGYELPAFPAGPADTDAWQRILAVRPDLAPAIEPEIRVLADGMAPGVDLSRAAQLRLTGNGVVPQQAALAFRVLAERIGWRI